MPVYSFPTNIQPGDTGQTSWANSIGTALNALGPLVDTKADDSAVVKLTGAQTVAGIKTFSSAPVVPDASFALAKVSGLVSALAGKASTTDLDNVFGIATAAVPQSRTVAGKALTADVTLAKADVGLGSVDNTSDASKPVSSAQQTALNLKANLASPTFTGTVSGITKAMVGLANVDNTADSAKPVSTAQQSALDLKAPLASPTFTGTVSGITKAMVGLGSVDNTADSAKPVSTAQQSALDLKAPLASPALTGTPTAPTAAGGTNTTQVATTAFVTTAVAGAGGSTPDASTTVKGKIEIATDAEMQTGTDSTLALVASQVVNAQNETMLAKVQFIPFGGTVTGSPGPYAIIIEAASA